MLCGWKVLRHLTCVILTCFHNFDVCVLVPLLCDHKTCYLFFFLHFLDLNLVIGYKWCASLCTILIYQVKYVEITPSECNISLTLKMELIDHLVIDLPWNHVDYSYKPWCMYLDLYLPFLVKILQMEFRGTHIHPAPQLATMHLG